MSDIKVGDLVLMKRFAIATAFPNPIYSPLSGKTGIVENVVNNYEVGGTEERYWIRIDGVAHLVKDWEIESILNKRD